MNWDKQEKQQTELSAKMLMLQDKVCNIISEISETEKIIQLKLGNKMLLCVGSSYSQDITTNPKKIQLRNTMSNLLKVQKQYITKYGRGKTT